MDAEHHDPASTPRPAYVVGYLRDVEPVPQILDYIDRIEDTLAPFDGEWVVHGSDPEPLEGDWLGAVVIIRFPDREAARGWWDSPGYREIAPLRVEHSRSMAALVQVVPPGYRAGDTADRLRRSWSGAA